MGAELQALRGGQPSNAGRTMAIGAGVAMLVVGAGVAFFSARSSAPRPPVVVSRPPPPPIEPVRPTTTPTETAAPIPLAPIPSPPRSTTARWNAKVVRAEGLTLSPGSTCTVDAQITTTATNALVRDLTVQCGAQSLYRSKDRLNGMSQSSNDARELLGPADDKSTFSLAYRDLGTRTGERTQIDLDTTHHQASVFRETIPRFRVELSLPTASVPGEPLGDAEHRLRRAARVTHVSGAAPVKEGTACVLRAMPTGQGTKCVAEVACGTTVLWPTTAPVTCTYDDASRPTGVATDEGPATLSLETSALTVKAKTFGADLTLDAP